MYRIVRGKKYTNAISAVSKLYCSLKAFALWGISEGYS